MRRTAHAKRYLDKYKRVDIAVDAYYSEGAAAASLARPRNEPSSSKLGQLFDRYKGAYDIYPYTLL